MAANLAEKVQNSLTNFKNIDVQGWSNSMHWIKGNGMYRQFAQNRISHIHSKPPINWHDVSTDKKPADIS